MTAEEKQDSQELFLTAERMVQQCLAVRKDFEAVKAYFENRLIEELFSKKVNNEAMEKLLSEYTEARIHELQSNQLF